MGLQRFIGEQIGRSAGRQAAESTDEVMDPQTDEERREASHQQVGARKALKGILRTEDMEDGFDKGYCEGVREARRRR